MSDTPAPGGSSFPAGNAGPVAQPLSAEAFHRLAMTLGYYMDEEEHIIVGGPSIAERVLSRVLADAEFLATLDAARDLIAAGVGFPAAPDDLLDVEAAYTAAHVTVTGNRTHTLIRSPSEEAAWKAGYEYARLSGSSFVPNADLAVDPSGHAGPADLHDPREEQGA